MSSLDLAQEAALAFPRTFVDANERDETDVVPAVGMFSNLFGF